jgi:hypothetical protein
MANHTGSEGTVAIGSNIIAEIRSFSIEWTSDTTEDTVMGDTFRTHKPTLRSWTASVDCFWDETDTNGQVALVPGTVVTFNGYPEGNTVGDVYYTGQAIVTGKTINSNFDGMVEATITLQGTGAITEATVV